MRKVLVIILLLLLVTCQMNDEESIYNIRTGEYDFVSGRYELNGTHYFIDDKWCCGMYTFGYGRGTIAVTDEFDYELSLKIQLYEKTDVLTDKKEIFDSGIIEITSVIYHENVGWFTTSKSESYEILFTSQSDNNIYKGNYYPSDYYPKIVVTELPVDEGEFTDVMFTMTLW